MNLSSLKNRSHSRDNYLWYSVFAVLIPVAFLWLSSITLALAGPPQIINYQGHISVAGVPVTDPAGQFWFALVNKDDDTTYWSNDGTSTGASQPTNPVSVSVEAGLFSIALGDTSITNMTSGVTPSIFANNNEVYVKVWYDDGSNPYPGSPMTPNLPLVSTPYALHAGSVPVDSITSSELASDAVGTTEIADGAITSAKLAAGAVSSANISAGSITATELAAGSITSTQLASGSVTSTHLASGAVTSAKLGIGSVTSASIATGNVTATHLASNAVDTVEIANGAVTSSKLAGSSVTSTALGADSVTSAKIDDNSVTAADLQDDYVLTGGDTMTGTLSVYLPDNSIADLRLHGPFTGAGRLFVGKSLSEGGGILHGDDNPGHAGSANYTTLFRRTGGNDYEVMSYSSTSNTVRLNGRLENYCTTDADGEVPNSGCLRIGNPSGNFLIMDSNEIMARTNGGTSARNLYLQTDGGNVYVGGSIVHSSDVNRKHLFEQVDSHAVLDQLASLPISEWTYKHDGDVTRHVGPTAQDFKAAFDLGDGDKHIATVDADGIALVAIKALREEKDAQIDELKALIEEKDEVLSEQARELADLKASIARLEQYLNRQAARSSSED